MFFMSVSAATVSSMSTVEMEVFSDSQLAVITLLMFLGGKAFTSMVGLHLTKCRIITALQKEGRVTSVSTDHPDLVVPPAIDSLDRIESAGANAPESYYTPFIKHDAINFLGLAILVYLLAVHVLGLIFVTVYFSIVPSAQNVLRNKGIQTVTFTVFITVSSLATCGFVPTNENMIVFKKNTGLLWILMPQVLLGNTLFPSCLRFSIWVLGKKFKKTEAKYLLKNSSDLGYLHLLPGMHSLLLLATVFAFILIGVVLFCALEWNSAALDGLNAYEKLVGVIFQSINARHAGESVVDLSSISPAILVFFIVMMYLPPYTSFYPVKDREDNAVKCQRGKKQKRIRDNFVFSSLSYIAIAVILICITERKSIRDDPINFSVLNIILEVISAYGNVGFSTGYGCSRQLYPDPSCVDKWYGFGGKWSDEGKIVLIIMMILGRLKKLNMNGGKAWKLL